MPMHARRESSTDIYHVTARGINKEHIFNQFRERTYFKTILKKYLEKYDVKVFAYCIMSNHIHLIIQTKKQILSLFMARILAEYAEYYNYKHNRNGHVFQNRFGSECIENAEYFWNCVRYIHMNPVKVKLTQKPESYMFSSLQEYQKGQGYIVSENAFILWEGRFLDNNSFLIFHYEEDRNIYHDIKDDIELQKKEAAICILNFLMKKEKVDMAVEIVEEKNLRQKYLNILKKSLNISNSETEKLYKYVKDSIISM